MHRRLHLLHDVLPRQLDRRNRRLDRDERADRQQRLRVVLGRLDAFSRRDERLCEEGER